MNRWPAIRDEYVTWLRTFPLLTNIGQPGDAPEIGAPTDEPVFLDAVFWSDRTHEAEVQALRHLTDPQIDELFDEVAAAIDEDLRRFDPLITYFGRFAPDGNPDRIEWEREAAHGVKRDLAWAAIERAIGEPSFFSGLLAWYDRGRLPIGWIGQYPGGRLRVV